MAAVGRPSMCGSCGFCNRCTKAAYQKVWSRKNKDRIKGYNDDESTYRASRKITCARYGLTVEDYDKMHEEQGGVCAICFQPETLLRKNTLCKLAIDHDKMTGKVRGLLCNDCNRAIGMLDHNIGILKSAIAYLEAAGMEY